MGETVGLLVGAVKTDRLQTKKLCQAVVSLQISKKWAREAGEEKGGVMQPLRSDQGSGCACAAPDRTDSTQVVCR